jgi:adenosylcobyric acid synthase
VSADFPNDETLGSGLFSDEFLPDWVRPAVARALSALKENPAAKEQAWRDEVAHSLAVPPDGVLGIRECAGWEDLLQESLKSAGQELATGPKSGWGSSPFCQQIGPIQALRVSARYGIAGLPLTLLVGRADILKKIATLPRFSSPLDSISRAILLEGLKHWEDAPLPKRSVRKTSAKRGAVLMLQGTSSHAGKSLITAAFCRMLWEDGFRVAPFKAQNMSLNSCVTAQGLEIARAQALQAAAARVEPTAQMNPLLLKPTSSSGSQVIVQGKPIGIMAAADYFRWRPQALDIVRGALDQLREEYDVVVMEGAGSPAEVNLMRYDVANMGIAEHAEAPVLVVGDIDRGGVFASFVGTMEVLPERHRQRVRGFLVNKFRGDPTLIGDAAEIVRRHTGVPTLGIIPWLAGLGLPEEDSVALSDMSGTPRDSALPGVIRAVVAELPHVSNFTDLDALRAEPGVDVKITKDPTAVQEAHLVLLPGSKNTVADLAWLRESGWAMAIQERLADGGCEVVGLCGGLQMLGEEVSDPDGIESGDSAPGLGWLPIRTRMAKEKTLTRTRARHLGLGQEVEGYEIHHGVTDFSRARVVVVREDGVPLGAASAEGAVWGTYLHGVLDRDSFRHAWLATVRKRVGLPPWLGPQNAYDIEPGLVRLAAAVRASVQWDAIRAMLS